MKLQLHLILILCANLCACGGVSLRMQKKCPDSLAGGCLVGPNNQSACTESPGDSDSFCGMPIPSALEGTGFQWICIPAGSFLMGTDDGHESERPVHKVVLSKFAIAATEVTVAQYRKCVEAGVCSEPDSDQLCNWGKIGKENHPVNCVDWDQAKAFSEWAGGRLPTEAEWEYAARSGGCDVVYPWGNEEPSCDYAVMQDCRVMESMPTGTWPVCSKPAGNTIQGLCDMAGNLWEWVFDKPSNYPAGNVTNPSGPTTDDESDERVGRGGAYQVRPWKLATDELRTTRRNSGYSFTRSRLLGFRPARSIP